MKKRVLLSVFMVVVLTFAAFAILGCSKNPTPEPGPETGTYYSNASMVSDTVQLFGGNKFTFSAENTIKDGKYTIKDNVLTLSFNDSDDGKIEDAQLENDILVFEYSNRSYRLYKSALRTVTFNSGQFGSDVPPTYTPNGTSIDKPIDPTHESGYQFIGWYKDLSFSSSFVFGTDIVTKNMELYAYWGDSLPIHSEFVIDFYLYEDAEYKIPPINTIGGKIYENQMPKDPTLEGFEFVGWYVSMFNDPSMPTYSVKFGTTVFEESTTLYAMWRDTSTTTSAPDSPAVSVLKNSIEWKQVPGATSYRLTITDPSGTVDPKVNNITVPGVETSFSYTFTQSGAYKVEMVAVGMVSSLVSAPSVRFYNSNSLARVSLFTVVDSSFLIFNEVANAVKYQIKVECGNEFHKHNFIDNSNSTSYDFSNCQMREEGILFTVRAIANNGMLSSDSKVFKYIKNLEPITNIIIDDATQLVSWKPINNATKYMVSVTVDDTLVTEDFDNGSKTSFSIKEYGMGEIKVSVYPKTIGFNSPTNPTPVSTTKTILASPANVSLLGNTVSWDEIATATGYTVKIGSKTYSTIGHDATSYTLKAAEIAEIQAIVGDYEITVTANGDAPSLPSDAIIATNSMFESISYFAGYASWKYVLGAEKYSVTVNGVKQGDYSLNRARINLGAGNKGENTIAVMPLGNSGAPLFDTAAEIKILAYKITFDGSGVPLPFNTLYKAFGDPLDDFPDFDKNLDGHDLEGWYTAPGGAVQNAAKFLHTSFSGGDLVLYAFWKPLSYTIKLNAGIGSIENGINTATVVFGSPFELPTPTIDGNGFIGWFKKANLESTRYTNERGESGTQVWTATNPDDLEVFAVYDEVLKFSLVGNTYMVSAGPRIHLVSHVVIPDTYKGLNVALMEIFSQSTIQSIHIGKNIAGISTGLFRGCSSLQKFTVSSENANYKEIDGMIFNKNAKDGNVLLFYPTGRVVADIPQGTDSIAYRAFYAASNLKKVNIPSSVTTISDSAFIDCISLNEINFSEGLKNIYDYAFANCSALTKITLPRNIEYIGAKVFSNCSSIHTITFSGNSSVRLTLSDSFFADCNMLSSVVFEEGLMLEEIPKNAFQGLLHLTSITLPVSVQTIRDMAFNNCTNLKTVVFEDGSKINEFGKDIFLGAFGLEEIVFNGTTALQLLPKDVFSACSSLKSIILPIGLSAIEKGAFSGCTSLTDITIPSSISNFTPEILEGCISLENIYTTIEPNAKYASKDGILYNDDLTTLVRYPVAREGAFNLTADITSIEEGAFKNCVKLTAINVAEENDYFSSVKGILFRDSDATLLYCPLANTTETLEITSDVMQIAAYAFSDNQSIKTIRFSNINSSKLAAIGAYAFNNCANLTDFDFPPSINSIGAYAFNGCYKLETIFIPTDATSIGEGAYTGLNKIKSITIPSSVTSIGANAFKDCTELENILFIGPNNIEYIGEGAFQNTTKLTTFVTTDALEHIGANAFKNSGLTSIGIPNSLTFLGESAFEGTQITSLTFKGNSTSDLEIGARAFYSCTELQSLMFEEGCRVTKIGDYAFAYIANSSLTSIKFPLSLVSIGNYAFYATATGSGSTYYGLSSITLNQGLRTIGEHAFEQTLIEQVVIPSSVDVIGRYAFYVQNASGRYATLRSLKFDENTSTSSNVVINAYAFYQQSKLDNVVLPKHLTNIKSFAFTGCAISAIDLPDNLLEIGSSAFLNCTKLVSKITVPAYINTIEDSAFQNSAISSVDFSKSEKLKTIGAFAFSNTNITGTLALPNTSGLLLAIGSNAFDKCAGITEILLPNTISAINPYTFSGTSITSLTIPHYVKNIASNAFSPKNGGASIDLTFASDSELNFVHSNAFTNGNIGPKTVAGMPAGLPVLQIIEAFPFVTSFGAVRNTKYFALDGVLYNPTLDTLLCYPPAGLGNAVGTPNGNFTVPSDVTTIGNSAFRGASKLKVIDFAANSKIQKIEEYAFSKSESRTCGITQIQIPNSLKQIGNYAFENATNLGGVNFENEYESQLTSIGERAFASTALKNFTITANLTSIGLRAFYACGLLTASITNKENRTDFILEDGKTLIDNKNHVIISILGGFGSGSYVLPEQITVIDSNTFSGSNITSITIHAGVTSIGKSAFQNCMSLREIRFLTYSDGTSSLRIIDDDAFNGCGSSFMEAFKLPNGLEKIGKRAFVGMSNLQQLTIPNSVKEIDDAAFRGTNLTNPNFSKDSQLQIIGVEAFAITNITAFTFSPRLTIISDNAFSETQLRGEVVFPNSLLSIGIRAFYKANFSNIKFENNAQIRIIGQEAFHQVGSLTEIDFGKGNQLKEIGASAFSGCNLASIVFPTQLERIGNGAFSGNSRLTGYKTEEGSVNFYADEDGVLFNSARNSIVNYPAGKSGSSYTIPISVTTIGISAFSNGLNSPLREVIMHSGITTIRAYAFANFSGTSLRIPYNTSVIEQYAFSSAKITIYVERRTKEQAPTGWYNFWNSSDLKVIWEA